MYQYSPVVYHASVDLQSSKGECALMCAVLGSHDKYWHHLNRLESMVEDTFVEREYFPYLPIRILADSVLGPPESYIDTVFHNHIEIVQLLLDYHANIGLKAYKETATVLMFAVRYKQFLLVKLLMEHKALLPLDDNALVEYCYTFSPNPVPIPCSCPIPSSDTRTKTDIYHDEMRELEEYMDKIAFLDKPELLVLVKREQNWCRRLPWLMV